MPLRKGMVGMDKRFLRFVGWTLLFFGGAWVLFCIPAVFSTPPPEPYLWMAAPSVPLLVLGVWLLRADAPSRGRRPARPARPRRKSPLPALPPSPAEERRQLLEQAKALAADDPALLARLERALDAFPRRLLVKISDGRRLPYVRDAQVDEVRQLIYQFEDCFLVPAEVDLAAALDAWLDIRATAQLSPDIAWYFSRQGYHGGRPRFLLCDAAQPDRSTGGRQALLRRCSACEAMLMLDLGGGYYQELVSGKRYKLGIGGTWPGLADDAATYGELRWIEAEAPAARPAE